VTGSGQSPLTPHSGPEHSITVLWWVMFGGACVGLTVITALLLLGWIRRNRAALPFGGSERAATRLVVGLGIATPIAGQRQVGLGRLAALALIAGAPAIPGAWLGGFVTSDVLGVLFFAGAAGAALEVVVEVGRYVARKAPGGLGSGYVLGGYLAGIAVMYVTGLLI